MTKTLSECEVRALLDALGGTSEEVAESLRRAEARGYRRDEHACPLAWHLRCCGLPAGLAVTNQSVFWDGEGAPPPGLAVDLPRPCRAFVSAFDEGRYPELAMEETPCG